MSWHHWLKIQQQCPSSNNINNNKNIRMSQGSTPPAPPQQTLPLGPQPFPGSLTPGWNDPPSVQYNSQATSTPGRTKLNKRVPFPMQTNQPSTKPTAIVHAMQCPIPATGGCGNIAVVHPMQYANPATPMHFPTLAANVTATTSTSTLLRESSQTPPPPQPPLPSSSSSTAGSLPIMSVPAVPRQHSSDNDNMAMTSSAIQHI